MLIENDIQLHRLQTSTGADCDRYLVVAEVRARAPESELRSKQRLDFKKLKDV
jgi:hypothetical protein